MSDDPLYAWLKSGDYMPPEFRDFHDQKDLFKAMHNTIQNANENGNARDGHIYVVDTFLWYMARCGYTLQKCRKNLPFKEFDKDLSKYRSDLASSMNSIMPPS